MLQQLTKNFNLRQILTVAAKKSYRAKLHLSSFFKPPPLLNAALEKRYTDFGAAIKAAQKPQARQEDGCVFIVGTLGPGGTERQATETLCALKQRNIDTLALFALHLGSELNRFYLPKISANAIFFDEINRSDDQVTTAQVEIFFNCVQKHLPPEIVIDTQACIRSLARIQPKIVHLWLDEVNIKGALAAVALGIPKIILSTRSLPPQNFALHKSYMQPAYKWLLKQAGVVMLNNSEAGARAYEDWLGLPCDHIKVIRNGFNFDQDLLDYSCLNSSNYRKSKHIPQDKIVIGTVIRFSEEKRPELWLEIATLIHKKMPDVHFLMVGDGPLHNGVKTKRAECNLDASVHMTGYEKEALSAIAAMDLLLLTSRAEGLPNVLIEAQALGVPVVTTKVGGAPEALDHGQTGWVLHSDDPESAANEIVNLLENKNWLQMASLAGPKFIQRYFGIDRMINETLSVYNDESSH